MITSCCWYCPPQHGDKQASHCYFVCHLVLYQPEIQKVLLELRLILWWLFHWRLDVKTSTSRTGWKFQFVSFYFQCSNVNDLFAVDNNTLLDLSINNYLFFSLNILHFSIRIFLDADMPQTVLFTFFWRKPHSTRVLFTSAPILFLDVYLLLTT